MKSGKPLASQHEDKSQPVTTWMQREGTMQSEISQSQKDKYCMIPLIGAI